MKTIIHVNQHIIKKNQKIGEFEPPLTIKTYKENRKAKEAIIYHNGVEVARVVYSKDKPLKCGARCWIETQNEVKVK